MTPSVLHTVRDLGRLREIAAVLARHGYGELLQRTGLGSLVPGRGASADAESLARGERIRLVLEELGPSFVKLGQILSTRADLIPADIIKELQRLQDDVPSVDFPDMKAEIEKQLGGGIDELFASFDEQPLASASIGQVYRARLKTDDDTVDVVVKVQRPNIGPTIDRDIDLLYWLAHAIERSIPEANIYSPVKLVDEFDRAIHAELDYGQEADNAQRFAANFAGMDTIAFPEVYRQRSSRNVITLGYLPGKNVFDAVKEGASGELIARNAVEVVVKMIFEHGFFHADPHPGNILILGTAEAPVVGLVDLGQVGRLTPRFRDRLFDLMIAVGREDDRAIADALYAMGTPTRKIDRRAFEAEVSRLTEKYLGKQLGDMEFAELIRDAAAGALKYGLEMPADLLMVGKAIMTVEGIGKQIYPALDLAAELKPHLGQMISTRYSPERITNDLVHLATRLSTAAGDFPARAEDILEDLRQGRLTMEIRQPAQTAAMERLGRRIFAGLGIASLIIAGAALVATAHPYWGLLLLGAAGGWGFFHNVALAIGKDRPPR